MEFEPQQTLSSMSAPTFRPPPWWSSLLAGVFAFVCLACAALGAMSATTNRVSTGDVAYAKSVIERLAFARPVASSARERALDVVENEMRASGAQVQRERAMVSRGDMFVASENIVGTLRGTGGGARIVIVAHADGVPNVSASGDDAFGVSLALSALRTLAREALSGDVVVVITGQEEVCVVCGAKLARKSPAIANADVVVNIDSGGDAGPFAQTQSTPNNARIADVLAHTPAFATSIVDGFSRVFAPAEGRTELAAFTRHDDKTNAPVGIDLGLLGGRRCYHAPCDNTAQVDVAALPGAVASVTSIARAVASSPAGSFKSENDAVLVALPSSTIAMPGAFGVLLVVIACVGGLVMAVAFGFKRFTDFALGLVAFFAAMLASAVLFVIVRAIASVALGSAGVVAQGPLVVGAGVLAAFGASSMCAALLASQGLGRARTAAFAAGSSLPFALLAGIAAIGALELGAAASVIACCVCGGVVVAALVDRRFAPVPLVGAAVALFTCAQVAAVLAMTASDLDDVTVAAFASLLAALSACAIAPLLARTHPAVTWTTSGLSIVVAIAFVVVAARAGAFDAAHPQPVSLSYAQSSTRAFLYTDDDAPAPAVLARLGPRAQPLALDDVFPGDQRQRMASAVPPSTIAAPSVHLVDMKPTALGATWRLAVYSNRGARDLRLTVHGGARAFRMGNEAAAPCPRDSHAPCTVRILGTTNVVVDVESSSMAGLDVTIADVALGLPAPYAAPWPAGVASSPASERSVVAITSRITSSVR